jgi:pterin-4a-carbinolamine dehydratase
MISVQRVTKVKTKETKPHVRPNDLSQLELDEILKRLAAWNLAHRPNKRAKTGQAAELHRQFTFESFEDAMHFMLVASRRIMLMDHHPEWLNSYKSVSVWLTTWEVGFKPSSLDVELAAYLDELYTTYKPKGQ